MAHQLATCTFCKIIRNEEPGEKIYEDEDVTCIKDINPVSTHHYLILPNKHIRNAKTLQPEDSELCNKFMAVPTEMAINLAQTPLPRIRSLSHNRGLSFDKIVAAVDIISEKMNLDPASTRTGFHWPPFNTVDHLHLHVISPVEKMNAIRKVMFNPNTFWFVSADYVKSRLEDCKS